MAAIVVFGLIATGVSTLIANTLHTTRADQSRVRAAALAAQEIEAVRAAVRSNGGIGDATSLSFPWSGGTCLTTATTCTKVVDGEPFILTRTIASLAATGSQSARAQVSMSVTWPDMKGVKPVINRTVLTARGLDPGTPAVIVPGSGSGSTLGTGTGIVSVTITGSAGAPQPSRPVVIASSAGGLQVSTDASGNALFTGLPAATYSVTVTAPGYIDQAGNAPGATSVTVTDGTTVNVALKYALPTAVTYTVTAPSTYTPASVYPITVFNGDLPAASARSSVTPAATTGNTTVSTWPASAITAWSGSCEADKPTSGAFAAVAGGTAAKTIALSGVQVTVNKALLGLFGIVIGSSPLNNAQVVAVKTADTGCPAGSTITFPVNTNSSGIAKVALPAGTWQIKVTGHNPPLISGTLTGWPSITVAAGATTSLSMVVDSL